VHGFCHEQIVGDLTSVRCSFGNSVVVHGFCHATAPATGTVCRWAHLCTVCSFSACIRLHLNTV
jgi:hypothetical protein